MNLTLHLTPEIEAKLQERAAIAGKKPEELVLQFLQEDLAVELGSSPSPSSDDWLRQFDNWVREHRSRNSRFDDSRESIYADRR